MTTDAPQPSSGRTRRAALAMGAAAGTTLLTGCTVYGEPQETEKVDGAGGVELAKTADIPEGGGAVFADQQVVVTQPQAGTFKAFSSTCTHAGCTVTDVAGGTINCSCHGSKFAIADGSVQAGPAPTALEARTVTVEGDALKLG